MITLVHPVRGLIRAGCFLKGYMMKMQDVKVGERYAYGAGRHECTILKKGVPLEYHNFAGVQIEIHDRHKSGMLVRNVPTRDIVCTWDEQEKHQAEIDAKHKAKHERRQRFGNACIGLRAELDLAGITARVTPHERIATIALHEPELVQVLARLIKCHESNCDCVSHTMEQLGIELAS